MSAMQDQQLLLKAERNGGGKKASQDLGGRQERKDRIRVNTLALSGTCGKKLLRVEKKLEAQSAKGYSRPRDSTFS